MNRHCRTALTVIALALLLPFSANAEIRPGSTEVGVFGGYNLFEKSQNLNNNPLFGGRVGYNFTRHFGIEGVVEHMRTEVDDASITGAKEGQFRSPTSDVNLTFYHLDAVYHLIPTGKFNPFILVGVGGAHYSPEISDGDMPVLNAGVGAKFWLADHVALRADLKDTMVTEIFQETYHNLGATLGITVAFGGAQKPMPARAATAAAKPAEPVVILVSEPKAEEKVAVVCAEPVAADKVVVLAFEDIHFDFDKATLTPQAQAILKRNLRVLQENPHAKIRIAGYTSASGSDAYNQKLSERRANAVKDFLVQEGVVAPDRLEKIGYGETQPTTYEAAPKDLYSRAAKSNMRALFEIIVKDR
ncbi:outer membrane porin OprF [Desulfuromonas carbonis]|uniref:OmpA family protein n=1 Tax=Desulfuromonas sp. DDH964 TaxID=1823759 RepID=UPI00078EB2C3|nr:OmpA family protein [Desulfuromonas sp. DDH964]AMV73760.1 peptidoglycan-binding outer membrane protein [Desulfuromonas sp. DDH964]